MRSRPWAFMLAAIAAVAVAPRLFAIPPDRLQGRSTSATFLDRSGVALGTVLESTDWRSVSLPLDRISSNFLDAIVASEDARFYRHGAIDVLALARASLQTLRCLCDAGGASTLTMQTARAQLALPGGIQGKLLQMWDAQRIEAGSGKRAILDAYVNGVAMGGNLYGVEAASRAYFGIPAGDLDLAQAALLAGLPNNPAQLDPREHWQAARARQRYVLGRMVAAGYITPLQAALAKREAIHVLPVIADLNAPQQLLLRMAPRHAGIVRTTIDLTLERFVQTQAQQVVAALASHNVTQAAALVIDNANGNVLAYLGSLEYFDDAYRGRNDGVRALRQPGSTLKPFLYEYALEQRAIRPDTVLADVPASYAVSHGESYSPQDYSRNFSGPVSVRTALADSLNVPAVRVLSSVGVPHFLRRLRDLGFTRLRRSADYYGLGLTLGAGEVTLWDLARAYVTLARDGNAIPLRTTFDDAPAAGVQIGDPDDWRYVTDVLADRYARAQAFGVGSVIDMPFPAAVKTGTSSGYRDTWTVGYTPEYTVAVWVGNFSGAPMQRVSGVSGAGPLWNRIMLHLYERRDPPNFVPPPSSWTAHAGPLTASGVQYDEWCAQQGATTGTLRILFPHDGDAFEDDLAPDDPRRGQQQIAFRISRPRGAGVQWTLNGRPLARSTSDAYFWTVQRGTFTLSVRTASRAVRVRFSVTPRGPHGKRGFAVAGE